MSFFARARGGEQSGATICMGKLSISGSAYFSDFFTYVISCDLLQPRSRRLKAVAGTGAFRVLGPRAVNQ